MNLISAPLPDRDLYLAVDHNNPTAVLDALQHKPIVGIRVLAAACRHEDLECLKLILPHTIASERCEAVEYAIGTCEPRAVEIIAQHPLDQQQWTDLLWKAVVAEQK